MSSEKYLKATEIMNDKQKKVMVNLFTQVDENHRVNWESVEDAVADILEAGKVNVGMLTPKESADASILNMDSWDYEVNGKYLFDEQNARALVQEYTRLKTENDTLKRHIAANMFLSRSKEL